MPNQCRSVSLRTRRRRLMSCRIHQTARELPCTTLRYFLFSRDQLSTQNDNCFGSSLHLASSFTTWCMASMTLFPPVARTSVVVNCLNWLTALWRNTYIIWTVRPWPRSPLVCVVQWGREHLSLVSTINNRRHVRSGLRPIKLRLHTRCVPILRKECNMGISLWQKVCSHPSLR